MRGSLHRWWLDRSVRIKGLYVVAVPLAALVATVSVSLAVGSAERHERVAERSALAVTTAAGRVLTAALNAETGVRGYALTHDQEFLAPYRMARSQIGADERGLRAAAAADDDSSRAVAVDAAAARVFGGLPHLVTLAGGNPPDRVLVPVLRAGKRAMDELRAQVAMLIAGRPAAVAAGSGRLSELETTSEILNISGLVLGLLAGLAGVARFTAGISRRVAAAAANADRLGEAQPLRPADHSMDDIGRLSGALARAEQLLSGRAAELTAARDEALRATQAKTAFLTATSHELRTPLNSILGFTQLLAMARLTLEDQDSVQRIFAAGRHLLTLINDLIDIARIESGELSLSLEPVALEPLAAEAAQLIAPLAAQRAITVGIECTHPGLAAHTDRQRLSQVLVNLLSNAVKYNRPRGAITLSCHEAGPGHAAITVTDTGSGLDEEALARIFNPFERLTAATAGIEGTGIGLPLARALTQAMDGQLTASSTPGQGSAFTITLPRGADMTGQPAAPLSPPPRSAVPAPVGPPASAPRPVAAAKPLIRVLYAEDNPDNIEVVSRFLNNRPNTTVHAVTTGPDGVEHARQHLPDLILLDLHLPGLTGEQVLTELKADPATAAIPVVILSAEASPSTIRRLLAAGARDYLTKPIILTELDDLLQALTGPQDGAAIPDPAPAAPAQPAPTQPAEAVPERTGHTVLYIEDDPANLRLMHRVLSRRPDTRLLTAQTAQDGLKTAATESPALILLDNRLPDATGSQVLAELTTTPATAAIPVVIISGDSGRETAAALMAEGAAGFVAKPFDVADLLTVIDQHLS
jgi:signal transduction histidine kinase/DNA-binding response OmpR family regulator